MEEDLNFGKMEDDVNFFQIFQKEDDLKRLKQYDFENRRLKKIVQPKTIKSKSNGCGTAPGNLVLA